MQTAILRRTWELYRRLFARSVGLAPAIFGLRNLLQLRALHSRGAAPGTRSSSRG